MGSTSQALSGSEKRDYQRIQENIAKKGSPAELKAFEELRAQIVKDILAANLAVQGELANEVRAQILYSGKYDHYK